MFQDWVSFRIPVRSTNTTWLRLSLRLVEITVTAHRPGSVLGQLIKAPWRHPFVDIPQKQFQGFEPTLPGWKGFKADWRNEGNSRQGLRFNHLVPRPKLVFVSTEWIVAFVRGRLGLLGRQSKPRDFYPGGTRTRSSDRFLWFARQPGASLRSSSDPSWVYDFRCAEWWLVRLESHSKRHLQDIWKIDRVPEWRGGWSLGESSEQIVNNITDRHQSSMRLSTLGCAWHLSFEYNTKNTYCKNKLIVRGEFRDITLRKNLPVVEHKSSSD